MGNSLQKKSSTAVGIFQGIGICWICLLFGVALLAKSIQLEWLPESALDYGVMVILILSSFLGAGYAGKGKGSAKLLLCGCTAAGYLLTLVVLNLVFFRGGFQGAGATALVLAGGTGLAMLRGEGKRRGKKQPKYRISNW